MLLTVSFTHTDRVSQNSPLSHSCQEKSPVLKMILTSLSTPITDSIMRVRRRVTRRRKRRQPEPRTCFSTCSGTTPWLIWAWTFLGCPASLFFWMGTGHGPFLN